MHTGAGSRFLPNSGQFADSYAPLNYQNCLYILIIHELKYLSITFLIFLHNHIILVSS